MTTLHPRQAGRTILLLAAVLTGTACNHMTVDIPHATPEALKAVLDTAPKPPGAVLIQEEPSAGQGDRATTVTRTYRIGGSQPACAQLIAATKDSGWTILDDRNTPLDPANCDPSVPNPTYTDPGNDTQRRGWLRRTAKTATIQLEWRHDQLIYILNESGLPS
jgi:hypothetical protein